MGIKSKLLKYCIVDGKFNFYGEMLIVYFLFDWMNLLREWLNFYYLSFFFICVGFNIEIVFEWRVLIIGYDKFMY